MEQDKPDHRLSNEDITLQYQEGVEGMRLVPCRMEEIEEPSLQLGFPVMCGATGNQLQSCRGKRWAYLETLESIDFFNCSGGGTSFVVLITFSRSSLTFCRSARILSTVGGAFRRWSIKASFMILIKLGPSSRIGAEGLA
jgi:hypothetical protein